MKLMRSNRFTLLATALCLLLSIGFVELFAFLGVNSFSWFVGIQIILFILAPISLIFTVSYAIMKSLKNESKALQLESVLLSYVCLILAFSGFYYFLSSVGDYDESVSEYHYYKMLSEPIYKDRITKGVEVLDRGASVRAFKGIKVRMWLGVRDRVTAWPYDAVEPPIERLIKASDFSIEEVIAFNTESRIPVFVDSIYFSVATITTLGYGDITPTNIYGKLIAVVEVLAGLLLVVVGIGIAFSGNGTNTPLKHDAASGAS